MGAWGAGSFENDAALDFASEIASVADLDQAFAAVAGLEYIEADEGTRAIVAGECVAAMRGHALPDLPDDLAATVQSFGKCPVELYEKARDGVSAVLGRSELVELWAEAGDKDWNVAVTDLLERLNKPARKAKKPLKKKGPPPNPSPCMFCDEPMGDGQFHMIDITVDEDEISSMKMGGWVHLKCLNAALHPKHMIQAWKIDEDLLEHILSKHDLGDAD